jgi:hypothetical protein
LAEKIVEESPERIVTFGVRPTYPPNRSGTSNEARPKQFAGGGACGEVYTSGVS